MTVSKTLALLTTRSGVVPIGIPEESMRRFEIMATTERDGEQVFLPAFYVDAENALEARRLARNVVGGRETALAVIAEGALEGALIKGR